MTQNNKNTNELHTASHIVAPHPGAKIWRYMDFANFMGLLQFSKLHFSRADKLEDVFEGKIPELFFRQWPEEAKQFYYSVHELGKEHTFVNCWTLGEEESYAMWQIYGGSKNGVAIQSDAGRLRDCFMEPDLNLDIKKVTYIDFRHISDEGFEFTQEQKDFLKEHFYACKSRQYEFEMEIRAIIHDENAQPHMDLGINTGLLIQRVYINPFASEWFVDLVKEVMVRYGLENRVVHHSNIEVKKK